ncbi:hypothetical protein HanRHA438_Chr10g0477761 [Helianthus annuus]|nr:hypothetical protein HanRHA438_Chr10g0477761 [Helianthus annuus]
MKILDYAHVVLLDNWYLATFWELQAHEALHEVTELSQSEGGIKAICSATINKAQKLHVHAPPPISSKLATEYILYYYLFFNYTNYCSFVEFFLIFDPFYFLDGIFLEVVNEEYI